MNIPSRRKLGAAALILAGIAAIAIPFMLLHGSSPQGASPNPGSTGGNNNNNNSGGKTTTTTTTPGGTNPGTSDSSGGNNKGNGKGNGNSGGTETCTGTKSSDPKIPDPSHDNGNGKDNGNAYGLVKNKVDNTVALMKAMGKSDPAFHLHHDTDTDNNATHGPHNIHDPGDHDSSCAAGEEAHDQD